MHAPGRLGRCGQPLLAPCGGAGPGAVASRLPVLASRMCERHGIGPTKRPSGLRGATSAGSRLRTVALGKHSSSASAPSQSPSLSRVGASFLRLRLRHTDEPQMIRPDLLHDVKEHQHNHDLVLPFCASPPAVPTQIAKHLQRPFSGPTAGAIGRGLPPAISTVGTTVRT